MIKIGINTKVKGKIVKCHIKDLRVIKKKFICHCKIFDKWKCK